MQGSVHRNGLYHSAGLDSFQAKSGLAPPPLPMGLGPTHPDFCGSKNHLPCPSFLPASPHPCTQLQSPEEISVSLGVGTGRKGLV